jgi:hypothetical protein
VTPATKARVMNQISKHRRYRSRTKARAIALKGGQCERCGFSDERALRFHHVKPVRRGSNGLSRKALTSTENHRAIVRGEGGKSVRMLCANCSCIAIAKDTSINGNLKYCLSLKLFAADDAESEQA